MNLKRKGMVLYLAGTRWAGVAGTDRRLAAALADFIPVLWVDPPVPLLAVARDRFKHPYHQHVGFDVVGPNLCRLRVLGPPGLTRPLIRFLTTANLNRAIRRIVRVTGDSVIATLVATPEMRFPRGISGRRVYFVTDDWLAGARMMGLSRRRIDRVTTLNLRDCDVVAAVSSTLLDKLRQHSTGTLATPLLLPNGCVPLACEVSAIRRSDDLPPAPFALVLGQINERLDIDLLNAVVDRGIHLVLIGPRTERDASTVRDLNQLFARDLVHWLGPRSVDRVPSYLSAASVGLTPYRDNAFNRASFPLKTLEYLAAGLPVVATDLPAVRWLDTELIAQARSPQVFADHVQAAIARNDGVYGADAVLRRNFAGKHSWQVRAKSLLAAL